MTLTGPDILQTAVGEAVVLHRLALAIECRDALADRPVNTSVDVRYRRLTTATQPHPAWRPLTRAGNARFTLRHAIPDDPSHQLPQLEIAVDDPSRRYVPRRFTVTPWTYAEVRDPIRAVDPYARLLRLWLRPGSAYAFPSTTTLIRGRVTRDGRPVRWARVEGTTPTSVAGWAHADERGEFVLVVTDPGYDPVRDFPRTLVVTLDITARGDPPPPAKPPEPDPRDRSADLVSEVIARPSNPPTPAELDNPVLRGEAVPAGYVANHQTAEQPTVALGAATVLKDAVKFSPKP